jgi:indolepyruvate ferredoxin oxidoreductase beta subunit
MAQQVWSPLIKEGEVDILLAFEKLEAARWSHYLQPGAIAIINNHTLPPLSVNLGNERYPSDAEITDILRQRTEHIYFVDGTIRIRELGNIRALNMFMLGCASPFTPLKVHIWESSISQRIPAGIRQINITAFKLGRKDIRDVHV